MAVAVNRTCSQKLANGDRICFSLMSDSPT
jgi:hypothetical protein